MNKCKNPPVKSRKLYSKGDILLDNFKMPPSGRRCLKPKITASSCGYRNLKWAFGKCSCNPSNINNSSTFHFQSWRNQSLFLSVLLLDHKHHRINPLKRIHRSSKHGSEGTQEFSSLGRVGEGREGTWSRYALESRQSPVGGPLIIVS